MGRGSRNGAPIGVAGRRIVVTGASRGIGRGLAEGFAHRGATVALVARPSDDLDAVTAATGGTAYPCDLGDPAAVAGLVERVEADGPVDVVVNNAGISLVGWAFDQDHDDIDRLLQVNLHAPIHLTRDWVPLMLERGRGHVVNVSSLAAVMSPPGLSYYSAAKAGVSAFTAALRQDLRDLPVHVTTVHLGSVPTGMDAESREYGPLAAAAAASSGKDLTPVEDVVAAIVDALETGRTDVRLPRMMALLPVLADAPRAMTRAIFKRYPPR